MGFKDKFKGAWKRVSDLDDETEGAKEQASASDRIPYKEISRSLKELMKKNVDVVGRKILIPGYYTVFFSAEDREMRSEVEEVLCDELKEELYPEMRKINPEQNKREVQIVIGTDTTLERGKFRIEYAMKKPAEGERKATVSEARPAAASPAAPTENPENDLRETVIEEAPKFDPDSQPTIIQTPADAGRPSIGRIVVESANGQTEISFSKAEMSIGRATQDDVVLESPDFSISRGHAVLEALEGRFFLTPHGVNGTHLNGVELELKKKVQISPGDEIRIMNYTLRIME